MKENKEKNMVNTTTELLNKDETNIFRAYCNIYHKAKSNWYRNLNDRIFNEDHDSITIRGMLLTYKSYLNGSLKEMSKLETPLTNQQIVNICFILMFLMGPFIRLINSKVLGYYLSDFDIASMTSVFRITNLVFIALLLRKFISLLLNIVFSSIMLSILNIVKFFQKLLRKTRHKIENGTEDVITGDLKDNFKWNTALKFGFIFINNILYLCIGGILIALSGTLEAAIVTLGLGITKALDITVGVPQRLISRILAVNGKIPTKLINISRSKVRDKTLLKSGVQGLNAVKTKNKEKKRLFDKITKSFERITGRIGKILDNIKNVSTPRRLRSNGYFGKGDANSIRKLRGSSNSSRQQERKEPRFSREEKTNDNDTKQQAREKNTTEKEQDIGKSNNRQKENLQENNNLTNKTTTEDKKINNARTAEDNRQSINNKVQDYENQKQRQEIDNGRRSETTKNMTNKNPSEQSKDSSATKSWNSPSLDAFRARANEKKDSSDNWIRIAEVITNSDINGDNMIGNTPIKNQKTTTDKSTESKQPEKSDKPKNQEQERRETTEQGESKASNTGKPQGQSETEKSEEELMFEMFRKSTGANRNADQKEEIINNIQQNNENVQKNVNNGKSVNNKSKSIF